MSIFCGGMCVSSLRIAEVLSSLHEIVFKQQYGNEYDD
jgi:hypothetical protein